MTGRVKIILNGHGGRLDEATKISLVEKALQAAGLTFQLTPTRYSGHATELAQQAGRERWRAIVAVGGDGTINEVVNGLLKAGVEQSCPLGIIPMGTANDFADALALPRDPVAACRCIAAGNIRRVDVGRVNGRYFINNAAVGLEPVVTITQDRIRYVKGNLRYVLAAVKAILTAKSWDMRLTWDRGMFEGPAILVSVGNTSRTGGAFFMTPDAQPDDGQLDFVYGIGMSRLRMLALLPKTFNGSHIHDPRVGYLRTKTLSITTTPPTPIQADGEVFEENAVKINYEIFPGKLEVIA